MSSEILNIVIDERKQLESVDNLALMSMNLQYVAGHSSHQSVFKDYLMSSEVFYVDNSLN